MGIGIGMGIGMGMGMGIGIQLEQKLLIMRPVRAAFVGGHGLEMACAQCPVPSTQYPVPVDG
ncbi:GL14712 [Drosophila persimilis]|uniref:GL14712 n=1 Tax=Drosophila persimilis TaxID=7234 RepID=B4GVS9_DROPE|nr:GL14712 [Drosophila persimilis]